MPTPAFTFAASILTKTRFASKHIFPQSFRLTRIPSDIRRQARQCLLLWKRDCRPNRLSVWIRHSLHKLQSTHTPQLRRRHNSLERYKHYFREQIRMVSLAMVTPFAKLCCPGRIHPRFNRAKSQFVTRHHGPMRPRPSVERTASLDIRKL
jgi:hypothetical protein